MIAALCDLDNPSAGEARSRKAGRQPLCLLHFEGTLNWYVVEEKFYCVLSNCQLWSKDPNRRRINCVFLKNDRLFRTFNYRLTFGIGK